MTDTKLTRKDIHRLTEVAIKMDPKDLDTMLQLMEFVSIHELKNLMTVEYSTASQK